jgi:hypothetical protein
MKRISSYLANYDDPSSGFSEGKLRDNPGDETGSGITVQTHNDFLYGFYAVIKKFLTGGLSDTDESETNSDFANAIAEAIGLRVDGVDDWSASTTYSSLGQKVMRAGLQFICVNTTSNLNKDPLTQPLYWMVVPNSRELFEAYNSGRVIHGGTHPMHDYNNAAYQQYFSLGQHKIGGANGTIFNAYGVHLDGSTVTNGSTLDGILDTWFLKTTFAPGDPKVLVDAKGRLLRAIDATGGQADSIGEVLEDQMQGHKHAHYHHAFGYQGGGITGHIFGAGSATPPTQPPTSTLVNDGYVLNPYTDGTNGTPRTGSTTRDKSLTVGVPYMVIMVAA